MTPEKILAMLLIQLVPYVLAAALLAAVAAIAWRWIRARRKS